MIRFIRALELSDFMSKASTDKRQISFCLLKEDLEKLSDIQILDGLTPSSIIIDSYSRSQKSEKDIEVLRRSYRMQLNGFTALLCIKGMCDLSAANVDFNIVVNTSAACSVYVDELCKKICSFTNDVEVLV